MKKAVLLLVLIFAAPAYGGSITITIDDSKDAKVLQALDLYNQYNGTSYSLNQAGVRRWVKDHLRALVVGQFKLEKILANEAAAATDLQQAEDNVAVRQQELRDLEDAENQGW
jgi:hypothetical protein